MGMLDEEERALDGKVVPGVEVRSVSRSFLGPYRWCDSDQGRRKALRLSVLLLLRGKRDRR